MAPPSRTSSNPKEREMVMKKPNPFTKPDTPKNERAEKRMTKTPAQYNRMEKKFEGARSTSGKRKSM